MAKNTNQKSCALKKTSIGGQALMEGIMMRGPEKTAMAVRNAKGEIVLETSVNKKPSKISKVPFLRGIFNMASSLATGYKYLMRSADIALADAEEADKLAREEKEAKKKETAEEPVKKEALDETVEESAKEAEETATEAVPEAEGAQPEKKEEAPKACEEESAATQEKSEKKKSEGGAMTTVVMVIGVVLGLALAIGLFIVLPVFLFELLAPLVGIDVDAISKTDYAMNLLRTAFESVLRILILVLYMFLVSRMKEIRRVFMYHGAEHKTIFCYEAGLELTVDNVRPQRRFHPRCGTSFIILVLLVGMVLGIFIPVSLVEGKILNTILRSAIKILLLPLTIGIGYELIKLAGRKDNWFTRLISAPGVWLQHITTVEPDDSMIECAIAAMNEVIPEDKTKDNW